VPVTDVNVATSGLAGVALSPEATGIVVVVVVGVVVVVVVVVGVDGAANLNNTGLEVILTPFDVVLVAVTVHVVAAVADNAPVVALIEQ